MVLYTCDVFSVAPPSKQHQGRCNWPSKHKPCPIWHGLWQSCASTTKRCWRLSLKSQTGSNFDFFGGRCGILLKPLGSLCKQKEIGRKRYSAATLGDFPCPTVSCSSAFLGSVSQGDVRLGRRALGLAMCRRIWSDECFRSFFDCSKQI